MTFKEAESKCPEALQNANPATLRSWRKRDKVPDSVAKAVAKPQSVARSAPKSVASVAEGNWWGIMPDGYARGYPGDTNLVRAHYRTPQAVMRDLETAEERKAALRKAGLPFNAAGIPAMN